MVYLDNSATTRVSQPVADAMRSAMTDRFFNPSALYGPAGEMERELLECRKVVGEQLGCTEKSVIFTSGGTESNNMAILGRLRHWNRAGTILYSAAEHPSVKNACMEAAELYAFTPKEIPLTKSGSLDVEAFEGMLNDQVCMICVMQVCNETGVLMPLKRVTELRDRLAPQAPVHVDGVQGFMRYPIRLSDLGIDSYSISAHKINGPKGVGALVTRGGYKLHPMLFGGGQQNGLRSGTENTPGIIGLRAAVESHPHPAYAIPYMNRLKQTLLDGIRPYIKEMKVLAVQPDEADNAAHILCLSLPPVRSETMIHALEGNGILVGSGSACSSKKAKHSAVLSAMHVPNELMDSVLRISLTTQNTVEEMEYVAAILIEQYRLLSRFTRR